MWVGKAVDFLSNRWVQIGLALVLLALWTAQQRDLAASAARSECRTAHLEQTIAEMERQRVAREGAILQAREQEQRTREELEALEREHHAIVESMQGRGSGSCTIPVDALDRLRAIR